MAKAPNFKLALARAIEPTGGPGTDFLTLLTIEDAVRFLDLVRLSTVRAPWWDFAAKLLLNAV